MFCLERFAVNLPLDECNFTRFEACPASFDLRNCLRASCSALRDSGWNNFSLFVAFCGFFVGAMSMETFQFATSARKNQGMLMIIISGRLVPTTVLDVVQRTTPSQAYHDEGPIVTSRICQSPNVVFRG